MKTPDVRSGVSATRVTRTREEARATYDALARWYDLIEGRFETEAVDLGLNQLAVVAGARVLEIGFGTGRALAALARSVGPNGHVVGIDISPAMCAVARARLEKQGLVERVQIACGDALHLPCNTDSLDAIFMSFTLELFDTPDIPVLLDECRRVLRPGGRIGVVALADHGVETLPTRLYLWAHDHWPRYVDCRPIPLRALLEQAGFHLGSVTETAIWGLPVDIVVAQKPSPAGTAV